jgi:hypothetical protein
LGFGEQNSRDGFDEASPARHGGMLGELIDQIAAGFGTDFVEQTVALRISEREDTIADEKKAGKIDK